MEKINITELLRNCPQGMELNCTLYYNVFFDKICEDDLYPIKCYTIDDGIRNSVDFTKYGEFHTIITSKCVIFPKGKTTWEGFVPPFKFKDGDILFVEAIYDWIFIYKENENKEKLYKHVATNFSELVYDDIPLCNREYVKEIRFATEEEKRKLFNAIKANGYKWNADTKTLEKLIQPQFKVGNVIQDKDGYKVRVTEVNIEDECYGYESVIVKGIGGISFREQDDWELVPNKFDISALKPFDKVLVRCSILEKWRIQFFEKYDKTYQYPFICIGCNKYKQYIPYEGNEHLLGKVEDCKNFYKIWE